MSIMHLPPFLFAALPALAAALIISAPEKCGGTHVVTHATAFFGPKPGTSDVRDVPLFAPRAQADGVYTRGAASLAVRQVYMTRRGGVGRSRLTPRPFNAVLRMLVGMSSSSTFLRRERAVSGTGRSSKERGGMGGFGGVDGTNVGEESGGGAGERISEGRGGEVSIEKRTVSEVRKVGESDGSGGIQNQDASEPLGVRGETFRGVGPAQQRMPQVGRASERKGSLGVGEADANAFSLFNACKQLSVPEDLKRVKGRVAVVARGVCDFAQKVGFMQDAGAVGVIVINFKEGGEQLANMKLNETKKDPAPITIPAVMISYKDWSEVTPCRNDTMVVFTAEGEATFDIDYGRDALNWAMMRGMALWILCQCGVNVVRYKRRVSEFRARADAIAALPVETYERPQNQRDELSIATENTSVSETSKDPAISPSVAGPAPSSPIMDHDPESVRLVPSDSEPHIASSSVGAAASSASTAVEDGDGLEEEPVCAVCLEEFESGQQVRLLACSHLYHRACIDPWLQSSSNCCPLCKREVPNLPPPSTTLHYGSMIV